MAACQDTTKVRGDEPGGRKSGGLVRAAARAATEAVVFYVPNTTNCILLISVLLG
jgi:hypothetical protein